MASVMPTTAPAAVAQIQNVEAEGVAGAFARQAGRLEHEEQTPGRDRDEKDKKEASPEGGLALPAAWLPPPARLQPHYRREQGAVGGARTEFGEKAGARKGGGASAQPPAPGATVRLDIRQALAAAMPAAGPLPAAKVSAHAEILSGSSVGKDKAEPAKKDAQASPQTQAAPSSSSAAVIAAPPRLEPLLQEHLRAVLPSAGDAPAGLPAQQPRSETRKPAASELAAAIADQPVPARHAAAAAQLPPAALPPRTRMESQPAMPTLATAAESQPGLTYRFQRWGGEHSVNIQLLPSHGAAQLTLQPSDSLVQQRLGEQWQHGNPQQWSLSRDGGERQQRDRQQPESEEDA
ncbi:type III secretion system needle length determinant, SpaN/EivJ family [Chromobacterium sphagni]|uniref:Surface presentation of antigen domain-containing protein n=1 Tax=Chromobacterium sphagni TaxID=1903179 RepID=A0ABX3CCH6_9NEIS|nr:type III secretion system needle length determinant, SpaN/EivJ family [Chromobacterium sphagni]OHX19929.1 hypothetical protein BI344_16040 [Chromobacterium sphagni]